MGMLDKILAALPAVWQTWCPFCNTWGTGVACRACGRPYIAGRQ